MEAGRLFTGRLLENVAGRLAWLHPPRPSPFLARTDKNLYFVTLWLLTSIIYEQKVNYMVFSTYKLYTTCPKSVVTYTFQCLAQAHYGRSVHDV